MVSLKIQKEIWPLDGSFTISRVSMTKSYTLVVELQDGAHIGRGECEPHESDPLQMEAVEKSIEALRPLIEEGLTRVEMNLLFPAGPARNALDCAMWDLEAKKAGKRAWDLAGVTMPPSLVTAYTICLETPEEMAAKAAKHQDRALLKLKLGASGSLARVAAVRQAAPEARLIVDANEAWSYGELCRLADPLADYGVELIEQPLPAGADQALENYQGSVPLCADESCLDRSSLTDVKSRYGFINIKLDKTGGLTEALLLAEEAQALGLRIMVGCMTGTSIAMAPAMIIGAMAEFCDLDGPLLLAKDRSPGLRYEHSSVYAPDREMWG
ncbi:N-acetyl-D-Glu racemase DgcA [Paremcibacter congregatus]|uniref:Dipeptide epimerase n=1 Tax=Paremcibacter congregatus TaxID=2043170 RepID=A0A2G4YW03_9PROT|nr:N-acetyl-D-Glu racemase DgcA [Paremcibacter congregatus]PHZ86524.1 dipeptide epimerase [Paremcibacter congregatus]QDE26327.1 dipeptide epimerase [Paremcibacter congregatus]